MTPVQATRARTAAGLTIEELARKAGVTPAAIAGVERPGASPDPVAAAKLRATLEALGALFGEGDTVDFDERRRGGETVPLEQLNSANDE